MLAALAPPLILNVPNSIPDSFDTFGDVIRYRNVVFLLKFHHHLNGFQLIRAQISESCTRADRFDRGAKYFSVSLGHGLQ